ncbi:unnamed protein product [Protopolystoma xenopodis]|uniref:Uncharacterized protein n=1 Tax=Protopolystoma xenopodis TaxID=117903 RepID=A0A448XEW0_9PLAT|nr:unnamed protein product [Protopolystoma xenopodis]
MQTIRAFGGIPISGGFSLHMQEETVWANDCLRPDERKTKADEKCSLLMADRSMSARFSECIKGEYECTEGDRNTERNAPCPKSIACIIISRVGPGTWYIRRRCAGVVVGIISQFCQSPRRATNSSICRKRLHHHTSFCPGLSIHSLPSCPTRALSQFLACLHSNRWAYFHFE